ncbi:MAG: acetamidase/formamidase family protein, partial [Acidobacteriota bacterium]|nr:acetamidase/formamidase family protein [Acidobacteriota bacterium]
MEPTVRIERDQHVWSFAADREPVVTVDPGTVIEIETWDCFTGQVQSEDDTLEKLDLDRVNSATGPIAVRGAEPGDSLSVTLLDIRPGTKGAAMCIPGWGQLIDRVKSPTTRIFDVRDGVVTMNERVSFPARPMFGVIGVSPESGDISTFLAGPHGGNMDDHVHGIGATLHMPVFQSGAQLAIGDMHASMGDGEISGTGVEIGGTGLIKVDLIKSKSARWPVTETADAFYTHGTAEASLDDALQSACEEASRLLVDEWGFTPEDAFMFLSVAGDLGIAQYCHPCPGSVIARMRV